MKLQPLQMAFVATMMLQGAAQASSAEEWQNLSRREWLQAAISPGRSGDFFEPDPLPHRRNLASAT